MKKRSLYLTVMLTAYSLLPGFSKLMENRTIFTANVVIILALLVTYGMPRQNRGSIAIFTYMTFTVLFTSIQFSVGSANEISAYTSYFMYVLPMLGFFIGTKINWDGLARAFFFVAVIHAVLGFLFYDFFSLPGLLGSIVTKLKDGVFQFRMASVSGSIVFGAVMVYGLISSAYLYEAHKSKHYILMMPVLLFSIILSQQRSAWGCAFLFTLWFFAKSFKKMLPYLLLLFAIIFFTIYFLILTSPELVDFFIMRLTGSLGDSDGANIVNERSHMWLKAIDQFSQHPLGLGVGQGGWIAYTQNVNTSIVVTDGDYFRLLLESGIFGVLIFIYLLGVVFISFIRKSGLFVNYFFWFTIGSAIQMVGSNITELYYINFAFWLSLGLNHQLIKANIKCLTHNPNKRANLLKLNYQAYD